MRVSRGWQLPALLVGVLGLAAGTVGCGSDPQPGSMAGPEGTAEADAKPGSSVVPPISTRQSVSVSDPCALLDPQDRSRAGLTSPGKSTTVAGSPVCDYVEPGAFGVSVTLDRDTDLEELRVGMADAEDIRVGAAPALRVADREADDGTCSVLLESGETGTRSGIRTVHVDVTMADFRDTSQACERATTVAEAIESELT